MSIITRESGGVLLTEGSAHLLTEAPNDYIIELAAASFGVTGSDVSISRGYSASCASASYSMKGSDVSLLRGYVMAIGAATYTVVGSSISATRGYVMACVAAVYGVTGNGISILYHRVLHLASASYAVTGSLVSLLRGYVMVCASAAYTVTGSSISTLRTYVAHIAAGSFRVIGSAIDVIAGNGIWRRVEKAQQITYNETSKTSTAWSMIEKNVSAIYTDVSPTVCVNVWSKTGDTGVNLLTEGEDRLLQENGKRIIVEENIWTNIPKAQ